MIAQNQIESYRNNGYLLISNLFSAAEVDTWRHHYMKMRAKDLSDVDPTSEDPLKRYPRMLQMHRWDEVSLKWLLDPRLRRCMRDLLGVDPYAVQTMIYFKPPGARGQALHQDQYYLRAQPGTCLAAWMAIDRCDGENGCMQVVPESYEAPVLCTQKADTSLSFTDVTVPVPEAMSIVPIIMEPGDVLFFNGSLIHGSYPNKSRDRFRRALIGHYVTGDAKKVSEYYHPVLRMDGTIVEMEASQRGGPCGVWVEKNGKPVVEVGAIN